MTLCSMKHHSQTTTAPPQMVAECRSRQHSRTNQLTFKTVPDYYLGFKLNPDGTYEEIYNGPGNRIFERFSHRKGIGLVLLSFPNNELKELSKDVPENERIPKRR